MVETMHAEQGVGMAANQVCALQKVAVIQLPDWEEALVLINPEIIERQGLILVDPAVAAFVVVDRLLRDVEYTPDLSHGHLVLDPIKPQVVGHPVPEGQQRIH
jgi:hypothetical protein